MAPLTWREVSLPNFSGVADSQRLAAQLWNQGFGALSEALGNFREANQNAASSAIAAEALRYTDPAAYAEALRSGSLLDGRGPINSQTLNFLAGRQNDLLRNQGTSINNSASQFRLDTARRDDQLAQARLSAQPEAARLLAEVRMLAGSGNAMDIEKARHLIQDNTQVLLNAGFRADQIPGLLDAERAAGQRGLEHKKAVFANHKFWEQVGISETGRKLAESAVTNNATPDQAIRNIQARNDLNPSVKAEAIQGIRAAAEAGVFQQPDPAQMLLNSIGLQPNVPASSNPLQALVDQTEGAGDYSTLYGHVQRNGGAFEGVDVSRMTIGQLKEFASSDGAYGRHQKQRLGYLATPMGRYQIVGSTLSAAAREMGLPDDTVFTPQVQDAIFNHLVNKRLSGPQTMKGKIASLREEWEGFKNVPDNVLEQAITAYESGDQGALTNVALSNTATPSGSGNVANIPQPRIEAPIGTDPAAQLAAEAAAAATSSPGSIISTQTQPLATNTPETGQPARETDASSTINPATMQDRFFQEERSSTPTIDEAARLAEAARSSANAAPQTVQNTQAPQTNPLSSAQTALDQSNIDQVFNRNRALITFATNHENADLTPAQVAARLVKEDGLMPGGNQQAVLQAINETIQMAGGNLAPHVAGALVANNAESRDLTSWFLPSFLEGDRFSNSSESRTSAIRTNMQGVAEDLRQLGLNSDGSFDLSRGVSQIQNQRDSRATAQQLAQLQTVLEATLTEIATLRAIIASGQDTPENRQALAEKMATVSQIQRILESLSGSGGPTTIFTGARPNLPN